jgi:hypothetical protein
LDLPSNPATREPAIEPAQSPAVAALVSDDAGGERRWLPATFSPAEQHRTEVQAFAAHEAAFAALRPARSASATLEPTRVTCQAFCEIAPARAVAAARADEPPSSSAAGERTTRVDRMSAASSFLAAPTFETAMRLALDAALLDWELPLGPSGDPPLAIRWFPRPEVSPATPAVEAVGAPAGDKPDAREKAASLWDADWRYAVPLVAAIAATALVSDRLRDAEKAPRHWRNSPPPV